MEVEETLLINLDFISGLISNDVDYYSNLK